MIVLNLVPKPEFVGIAHKTGGWESGLCVYHMNQTMTIRTLYIAAATHLEIINELIANTGNRTELLTEFSEPENPESQLSVTRVDAAQYATIAFESTGRDWFSLLSKRLIAEIASGMESVTVPTSCPLPADMEKILTDLNLVFCGLSPRSLGNMDLAYCLTTRPVDFTGIKLADPVSQKLLMHIEQEYGEHDHPG